MVPDDALIVMDTCVLIHYIRGKATGLYIDTEYKIRKRSEVPIISIVTHGELLSMSKRSGWGKAKLDFLADILSNFVTVNIDNRDIVDKYAEIDIFSRAWPGGSRVMGKNDLWIAATASLIGDQFETYLLTNDGDFDHLNGAFLKLEKVASSVP